MARITLEQQDEITGKLLKAEAILSCFLSALEPSSATKISDKTILNTVWALSELIVDANKIAGGDYE